MSLYRNGSGYYDPTAYKALRRIEKEEIDRMKKGDIWRVQKGIKEVKAIILSVHDPVCMTLQLTEENKGPDNVEVLTLYGQTYYARPVCLTYDYIANFIEQEDGLTPVTLNNLKELIADALEMPKPKATKQTDDAKVKELRKEIDGLRTTLRTGEERIQELEQSNQRLGIERDLYVKEFRELQAQLLRN